MSVKVFVDTNVLVYRRDASEPDKQRICHAWLTALWDRRAGALSFQVLQEYYITVTRKLSPGLDPHMARDDVRALLAWRPHRVTDQTLEIAWFVQDRYGLSWWDSLIVAAAQLGQCRYLLTEDLQSGQTIEGVKVLSPFDSDPETSLILPQ
jgi:predicted nucleic acid-binding protein